MKTIYFFWMTGKNSVKNVMKSYYQKKGIYSSLKKCWNKNPS